MTTTIDENLKFYTIIDYLQVASLIVLFLVLYFAHFSELVEFIIFWIYMFSMAWYNLYISSHKNIKLLTTAKYFKDDKEKRFYIKLWKLAIWVCGFMLVFFLAFYIQKT